GPWGHHHPRHHIPLGVHTLDIDSVILDLEQPRGSGLLWRDPELLPRIGSAFALLHLDHVHGPADRWYPEHACPSRDHGTRPRRPRPARQHNPPHTHRRSPLRALRGAEPHQTT